MSKLIERTLLTLVFFGTSISLTGCNEFSSDGQTNVAQHDGQDLFVNFALPRALTGLPVEGLQAQVSIDGGIPTALFVDPDDNTASETIEEVPAGNRQLIITYFVLESGVPVELATAQKIVDVVPNAVTRVEFAEVDLNRNIDTDRDGYTNLSEVRLGTSTIDKFDSPAGGSPLFVVSNGSFAQTESDTYLMKHVVGTSAGGSSESINYIIVSGFTAF